MYRIIIIALFCSSFAFAQTKKPAQKNKPLIASDSLRTDSLKKIVDEAPVIPKEFAVYSKRPKVKTERMKLCLNLVSEDTILNYCMNDSLCKDPEVSKILFEQKQGDTTYVLVYVQAFSKPLDKVDCDAGKELKLFFVRWNTKTNKAVVKFRNVESCMKGITNMTAEPILNWDRTSVLLVKYYRSGEKFVELTFDPQKYLLGLQSISNN
jgi:hypothetical protein